MQYYHFCRYGNISDYGWISFYSAMQKIGVKYSIDFKNYIKLYDSGIFTMIMAERICAFCPMPTILNKDIISGKLHDTKDYSIQWSDGYKLAFVNGFYIDYELFEKFKSGMSLSELMQIPNIEQRYALMKEVDKKLMLINATLISETVRGNRLFAIEKIIPNKTIKMLNYKCPSTGREYFKFVPYEMINADKAQAWCHHYTLEEYLELINES
jgi:hypothetical protein